MTNAEKYLKDNVNVEELWENFSTYYYANKSRLSDVNKSLREFMKQETKPTLTEDERVKEMVYSKERKREMLATGYYFGLLYYVLSLGTHPTAYVKIPESHWLYNIDNYDDMPIDCHGGLTYCENFLYVDKEQEIKGKFIGWDYAHCDDYAPYYDDLLETRLAENSKKWTTQEILKEVKEVCSQIIELEKKPHLTEDERVVLRNMEKGSTIGRHDNKLYVYSLELFPNLFKFIKERRRILNRRIIRR